MAVTAESIIIDLEVRGLSSLQRDMAGAATATERGMSKIEAAATRAEASVSRSAGRMRAATQQLGFQVGDIAQQLSQGTNLGTIFAQQSGQVVQAFQLMGGEGNKFLRFLSGPWGIALSAGAIVLAPFIARLFDTRSELEKTTDELTENARKAEITRQAQEAFGRTLPGVIAQIRSETEALEQQNHALRNNAQALLDASRQRQSGFQREQAQKQAELRQAQQDLTRLRSEAESAAPGTPEETQARGEADRIQQRIRDITSRIAQLQQAIQLAERETIEAEIGVQRRRAEALADPIAAINQRYDEMAAAAERAAEGNRSLRAALDQTLASIERQRRSALEAQRAENRVDRTINRPSTGAILSPFGADRSRVPLNGRLIPGRRHEAVDIRGNIGDPVVAPEGGTATVRSRPGGLGLYVEIRADSGARDLLAHLSQAFGPVGSSRRVDAGEVIGAIGDSGNARGGIPHLHHQRYERGRLVDPSRRYGASGAAQAARQAQQEAERRAEQQAQNEAAFQQELARLGDDLLEARRRNVENVEQLAEFAVAENELARERRNDGYQEQERRGRLTAAQREQLVAANDAAAAERRRAIHIRLQQQLDEERYRIAVADLNDAQQIEQARGQLARTIAERRDSELRLLELQRQEELAANERLRTVARLNETLTAELNGRLDRARDAINQRFDSAADQTRQRNMTPLQQFIDRAPSSARELDEALEGVAANGLSALNDGLAEAIGNFVDLGGTAGRIVSQMIADIARLLIYQNITAPLAGALQGLFGGGGGAMSGVGIVNSAFNVFSKTAGLRGFATGYVGPVGGLGGVDRNILSINGQPRARVSGDETLAIIPQGKTLGYAGGAAMGPGPADPQRVTILVQSTGDFEAKVAGISGNVAVEVVQRAAPEIAAAAEASTLRRVIRPRLNRG